MVLDDDDEEEEEEEEAESVVDLETEVHGVSAQWERMQIQLRQVQAGLKSKEDEVHDLQSRVSRQTPVSKSVVMNLFAQLSMAEVKLRCTEEERDNLRQDLDESELGRDQLVRKAWEKRDEAVKRKNAAEVDLAKERVGVMQVNSGRSGGGLPKANAVRPSFDLTSPSMSHR